MPEKVKRRWREKIMKKKWEVKKNDIRSIKIICKKDRKGKETRKGMERSNTTNRNTTTNTKLKTIFQHLAVDSQSQSVRQSYLSHPQSPQLTVTFFPLHVFTDTDFPMRVKMQ